MVRRHPSVSLALVALLFVAPAQASIVIAYELVELARRADDVVIGEVVAARSEYVDGMVITRSTLRVEENVGGTSRVLDELEVITPGGEFAGVGVDIEGAPQLTVDRRYLCFLQRRSGAVTVVGLAQGALPVITGEDETELVLPPAGLPHLARQIDGRLVDAAPALMGPRRLAEVVAIVREARHGL